MKNKNHATNIFIKECITQALIQLLENKTLSSITITELTRKAGVSRMAYYRNFNSKEEIFSSYLDIIITQYDEVTESLIPDGTYSDMKHMIHYFSWLLENKDFFFAITNSGYDSIFLTKMTEYILSKWNTSNTDTMTYYKLIAFSGSLYNLYKSWSKNNFEQTPEEMATVLYSIHHLKYDE